jgi:hypothetical protein
MAVNYVDRFLAAERSIDVVRSLKLIGIVSLFIAAKAEVNLFLFILLNSYASL